MPTVPRYDNFQVTPNTLPTTRLTAPDMPDVAGREAQRTGQDLSAIGSEIGKIALEMQQQADQVRLNDAMNEAVSAKNSLTYDPSEGFVHLKGNAALERPDDKSLNQEYLEKLKERLDDISGRLGNDRQRAAFAERSGALLAQFDGALSHHVGGEFLNYRLSVNDGTNTVSREHMALNYDDVRSIHQGRNAIKAASYDSGKLKGLSDVEIEANIVRELSLAHSGVINAAVDAGQLDYARAYMKEFNTELTPAARLQLKQVVDIGQAEAKAQEVSGKLFDKHKGNIAGALAEARETLTGKEEDAVVTRLKNLDAERVALRERGQKDAADRAWKIYAQTGDIGRVPPSVLASMDGRDIESLRRTARTEAGGKKIETDVGKWLEFTNLPPKLMASMTPQQLLRDYRPYLSDADLRRADEMIQAAQGLRGQGKQNADGLQLMTTNDLLQRTAQELGILPSGKKASQEQQSAYLQFTDRMQVKINQWEAANDGKKASPEVLRDLLDKEKMNIVRADRPGRDPDLPYITLSNEEQNKAYVVVGSEEIKLSSIPSQRRAQIVEALQASGQAVTESEIARLWVKAGKPK
ncbi:MAG: hypothetical protein LBI62_10535 [Candidatus Accumulibacter sp.]|jgi:hypothetical protein|nr:hypothetical protein [Accumulibacter sp.]